MGATVKSAIVGFMTGMIFSVLVYHFDGWQPPAATKPQEHWSKWGPPNQPWSEWNGALQYRTNLDTGLIQIRNLDQ